METRTLISCEHGGNRVPTPYRHLFAEHRELLTTHRGYDAGALAVARELARALRAPLVVSITSRLLVDLNRSPGHPRLYGEMLRTAPVELRREVFERHYLPYRERGESLVADAVASGARVIHLSSHSFTPELDGEVRNADVGLLYDPARPGEVALCTELQAALAARTPQLKVRRNYPYRGTADGFCTWLRRRFPPERYIGIELEINQKHVLGAPDTWRALRRLLVEALAAGLAGTTACRTQGDCDGTPTS